ncbi:SusC/RagA family TonB-linked outer membrane protein [Saccharicrinis sp. 156]|uniref:SusC/RagA family TonB-linked outer membrane protein n=1 Tax=Saccharicrinis sp. 156 TaxID=3417574 RepID=UPI003D328EF4
MKRRQCYSRYNDFSLLSKSVKIKSFLLLCILLLQVSNTIVSAQNSIQEKITITGVVSDEFGEAIPGVTILLKGTSSGIITDLDGRYNFKAPMDATLVFSFVGMKTREIQVKGKTTIDVVLKTDAIGLDEVVAVGYGVQKKETLTGSIETVRAEVFEDQAVSSPALALQGQTPGLVVTRSSSQPGDEGIDFQIRGATSVNGGEPLIVIDGIPAINTDAFYSMNSDDIEAISILKDGAAAIYGSRAANGVILVTTKGGNKGGDVQVNYSSSVRVSTLGISPVSPTMQNYGTVWLEGIEQDRLAGDVGYTWKWTEENLRNMQSGYEGIYTTSTWGDVYLANHVNYDELYGSSVSDQHNLSISTSSEKSTTRVSLKYAHDRGSLQPAYDGKATYNARINNVLDLNDWFQIRSGVSYLRYKILRPQGGYNELNTTTQDPSFFPAVNPYGQWNANFGYKGGGINALAETVDGGKETQIRNQVKLNIEAKAKINRDLSFKLTGSLTSDFYEYQKYTLNVPTYGWFGTEATSSISPTSSIEESQKTRNYQNYGAYFDYKKSLGDHNFAAMVGANGELFDYNELIGKRIGFEDYGVYNIKLGSEEGDVSNNGNAGNYGYFGFVGRLNYNYKNKYLIEVSGRRDGSSKFDEGYKFKNYFGGSMGWILTEEDFLQNNPVLSFFKLRASYGEMGNNTGIGEHDYVSTISYNTAVFGTTNAGQQTTSKVSSITTNERTWEKVSIATIGTDFRLFDNMMFGSFDYFFKKNDGMLISIEKPAILGGSAPKSNYGVLETEGWEASLGIRKRVSKDFTISLSMNMSDSRNKLVEMEGVSAVNAGLNSKVEGYALNSYFVYGTDGYFADQGEVDNYYSLYYGNGGEVPSPYSTSTTLRPGDTRKLDLDGSGTIEGSGNIDEDGKLTGDLKHVGDNAAHYTYGINLGAEYKNFDLTGFFQGVLNQNVIRTGYMAYPMVRTWTNQTSSYIGKTWTEENTGAAYPRMTSYYKRAGWNWANNDFMVQNSRYLRLKSLVVGYTLKNVKISKHNIDKLRVYFSGNDLFEFTSIKDGYDPEYGDSSKKAYPLVRSWSFGLNLTL